MSAVPWCVSTARPQPPKTRIAERSARNVSDSAVFALSACCASSRKKKLVVDDVTCGECNHVFDVEGMEW